MITTLIQEPLRTVTTGLVGCVILYSLGNFLWLLGIHQSVIYSSILEPLLIVNMTQNMAAYAAGEAIPNIINVALVPGFGMMGGSGSTICLLIATFLVGRNKATRGVAKMAFVRDYLTLMNRLSSDIPLYTIFPDHSIYFNSCIRYYYCICSNCNAFYE